MDKWECLFWVAIFVLIVTYGVMLGFLTKVAHEECGGWSQCFELAVKYTTIER